MFKKRAQGLSITVIIAAVIGLIIIVVVVMMLTGKLGAFGRGTDESVAGSAQGFFSACKDACKLFTKEKSSADETEAGCKAINPTLHPQVVPGSYSDVPAGKVCCCRDYIV